MLVDDSSSIPNASCETVSPMISQHASRLKKIYAKPSVSRDSKWPVPPRKELFVRLALVLDKQKKRRDADFIDYTLHGDVSEMLKNRKEISMDQILEAGDGTEASLVLIEGAPGIGKSTLAGELCRKWEELPSMKNYNLVVLLRLSDEEVQIFFCMLKAQERRL